MSAVTAIVIGAGGGAIPRGAAAEIATPDLGALVDATARATTPLVWLLDSAAVTTSATLPALLEHAEWPAASLPVDSHGAAVEAAIGRIDDDDPDVLLGDVRERRVPLRHAPVISLLLARELAQAVAPPDPARFGGYAGTEWTARLFARRRGVLVPASRVEVSARAAGSPVHAVRTARSGAWRRGEAVRETYRAVASLSGRARAGAE